MTVESGRLLHDRYRLQEEIGRGGMASVYRARDQLLERDVAVKVIHKPDLTSEDRQRLLREARLAARLNHPNIVAVHDAGEIDDQPYIVMELVEGESLFQRPPNDLTETLSIASQLSEALVHAHDQGIVHRDLKPENILRTPHGTVKLTDFGLALSLASRLTGDGIIVGTVFYLAPEQLLGKSVDGRADLYALGVLLYEWTTGELPFGGSETLGVIAQHLYASPVAPRAKAPSVPPGLDRLVLRLLSKSPDDRPVSARQVLESLRSPDLMRVEAQAIDIPILDRIGGGRIAGREAELAVVRGMWARATSGKTQTLIISGEAGIGKTRLVRELSALAEVSGGLVLQGWCYAQPGEPYGPFQQILREAFDGMAETISAAPDFVAAAVLSLAPEYQKRFPDVAPSPAVDTAEGRQRNFEGAELLLSMLSQKRPVLLVLEDAQWADSGTLDLFRHLVQHTRERPVLFVLTHRDVEPEESRGLHEMLHDFRRGNVAVGLPLTRLDRSKTEDMLTTLLGESVAPDLADEIFRVTEGNPFFIEEVCKTLAQSGRLTHRDGRWQWPGIRKLEIPVNVKVAIAEQLRALQPGARKALEAAAIRGPQFGVEIVRRTLGVEEDALADALEAAERAKIIQEIPGDGRRYAFTHHLIPAAIVDGLRASERRSLHGRMAPVLERLRPEEYESLAEHYRLAGDAEKASDYLVRAGDRARALHAVPETIENYTAALRLQKELGRHEEAARTLMRLGLAYSADFQFDKAQQAYQEAFEILEPLWQAEKPLGESEPPVTLRYAIDEPPSLDPGMAGDDITGFVVGQIFEGLLELDEAAGVVPALARRWEVSGDGRHYTFHLRPGRVWADGTPLTAGDFEYAWKRNLALGPQSAAALLLSLIDKASSLAQGKASADDVGVRAVDDLTLEVRLERPAAFFPYLLSHPVAYPLPRRVVEGERQPWPQAGVMVGNGPFRLTEWTPGRRMVFERNPLYRGLFPGNVSRIEAPLVDEFGPLLEAFDQGALDGISLIRAGPSAEARVRASHPREFSNTPALSLFYLSFLTDRPPFDAPEARKAFIHAVDRTAVPHLQHPALGGFLPPGMPGHSSGIGLKFDPNLARRLLAEAGYPDGKGFPAVELLYTGDRDNPEAAYLKRAWREVLGIEVETMGVEWGEFLRRRDHEPSHLTFSGWSADYPDPDNLMRVLFHSREGLNSIRWNHSEFDRLVEEAGRITERKKRIELYRTADQILVAEQAAVMPLRYTQGRRLVKAYLRIPRVSPSLLKLKDAVVEQKEG
ncbi:MAG TPA: ABC transporter substrate-binding protein [Anaerolineales bacterium]|nr:ABC transporter substrate-binding protein [Anaerolineales bacterium]